MFKLKLRPLESSLQKHINRLKISDLHLKPREQEFVRRHLGLFFSCDFFSWLTFTIEQNDKVFTPPRHEDTPLEDDEPVEIEASPSPPPRRTRAKSSSVKPSSSKQTTETVALKSTGVESQALPNRTARKSTGGKPPPPRKSATPAVTLDNDSEIEVILDPKKKKGKAKATDSDDDQIRPAASPRKNGKRKATSDDDDDIQVVERPKRQKTKTGRAGSEVKETARTRTKPSSRATSKQPIARANEEKDNNGGADVAQKNLKKRKINIFPAGNEVIQFSLGRMANVCFFFYLFT